MSASNWNVQCSRSHERYGVLQHEPDKLSPWRVRGTPLGGGAAASQLPDTEDVNAAMAAAGHMAAFFSATQAEPDTHADTDVVVSGPLPTSAVQAKAADGHNPQNSDGCPDSKAQQNKKNDTMTAAASAAAGSGEKEQATAAKAAQRLCAEDVAQVKSMQTKKGSDAKEPATLAGADIPPVSDGAAAQHMAQSQEEGGSLQQEEEIQAPKAAGNGRGKGKGRGSVSTKASADDGEEEEAGKRKARRGRGSAGAGVRGGSRGRKASGQGPAAKGPLPTSAADSDVTDMDITTEKPKVIDVCRQTYILCILFDVLLVCLAGIDKHAMPNICMSELESTALYKPQGFGMLNTSSSSLFQQLAVQQPTYWPTTQQTLIWQHVDDLPAAAGRGSEEQEAKISRQGGQPSS